LSELTRLGDPERSTAHHAAVALARTAAQVRELTRKLEKPASTTFLATDGKILVACRRGRTLHLAAPAPNSAEQRDFVALASENPGDPPPGGRSGWTLLEEDALVTVDESLRLRVGALAADA
jgi:glutamine amidotransferase